MEKFGDTWFHQCPISGVGAAVSNIRVTYAVLMFLHLPAYPATKSFPSPNYFASL